MEDGPERLLLNLFAIFTVLVLHGFFVATELAITRIRGSSFQELALEGKVKAKYLSNIFNNQKSYVFACQLGIALTSLALGWLGEPAIASMIRPLLEKLHIPDMGIHIIAFLIGFTLLIALHMTLGKQIPKTFALLKSAQVTLWFAMPIVFFKRVMYPLIWCLEVVSNWIQRRSGVDPRDEFQVARTEEDIKAVLEEVQAYGTIDKSKLTLFDNVLHFSVTVAREIMIPRTEMDCLYTNLSFEENLQLAMSRMHTRYPLCKEEKDHVVGFVHIKDLLKATKEDVVDIKDIARPLLTVPETLPIHLLLMEMQTKRTEAALLVDEYGGTLGFVTMEDILEEIVGEIYDEFDEARPSIEPKDNGAYSIDGLLQVDEFSDYFQIDLEDSSFETIGGWLSAQFDAPPKINQSIVIDGYELIVAELDHMRISRITLKPITAPEAEVTDYPMANKPMITL